MKRTAIFLALSPWMLLFVPFAYSDPIEWTLDNVSFDDGGAAAGSFTYDPSSGIFSAIDIVTTAGSEFGGYTYETLVSGDPNYNIEVVQHSSSNLIGDPVLLLGFASPLPDTGGVIPLGMGFLKIGGVEGLCYSSTCGEIAGDRSVISGSVTGVPSSVPEPGSCMPLALGLGSTLLAGRRRISARQFCTTPFDKR